MDRSMRCDAMRAGHRQEDQGQGAPPRDQVHAALGGEEAAAGDRPPQEAEGGAQGPARTGGGLPGAWTLSLCVCVFWG